MSERAHLTRILDAMVADGWSLSCVSDGETDTPESSVAKAVEMAADTEHAAIELTHGTHGRVVLSVMFGEGAADLVYDYRATAEVLDWLDMRYSISTPS